MKGVMRIFLYSVLLSLSCSKEDVQGFICPLPSIPNPVFTHPFTDLDKLWYISPIGEVTGDNFTGHTFINIDQAFEKVPIYAPTDMGLVNVYRGPFDYSMHFKVSQEIDLEFGHITEPIQEIADLAGGNVIGIFGCQDSVKLEFSAGDLLAYTSGTIGAMNFDFGVYNSTRELDFINKKRFEHVAKWLNASCPYDYYTGSLRDQMYALFGPKPLRQELSCRGSRDKAGTIAGGWFDTVEISDPGHAQTEFSPVLIATTLESEIRITLGESDMLHRIYYDHPTFMDPEEIITEHCYEASTGWHFYFQLQADGTLHLAWSESGPCPGTFPEEYRVYYR